MILSFGISCCPIYYKFSREVVVCGFVLFFLSLICFAQSCRLGCKIKKITLRRVLQRQPQVKANFIGMINIVLEPGANFLYIGTTRGD